MAKTAKTEEFKPRKADVSEIGFTMPNGDQAVLKPDANGIVVARNAHEDQILENFGFGHTTAPAAAKAKPASRKVGSQKAAVETPTAVAPVEPTPAPVPAETEA